MATKAIANRIRELRFAAGEMTQSHLALRVGVTRQTIISIEKGKYSPSLEVALRIAAVLDEPFDTVFQYDPALDKEFQKGAKES
ncbi:MAG: helix-turn-helix transcriptional regulator [Pseudomonadota bacterium]